MKQTDVDRLIIEAFRAGYEAGYMHAGPKGLVLEEAVPSQLQVAAILAAAGVQP